MGLPVDPDEIDALHERLLGWFADHRRELPWRDLEDEDPYHVLVREIMLQQTRMNTALPYYERWLDRWPTVEDLAQASEEDVLDAWQGLGYYNRARWLLDTARTIVEDHDGEVPQRVDELEQLKGVGPYTAAAVASMVFGKPAPSVDGNMARVVARIEGLEGDVTRDKFQREIRMRLEPLFERGRPGRLNETLMEVGSLVCTPAAPNCEVCPLADVCTAYAEECVEDFPTDRSTPDLTVHAVTALAITDGDRVLATRRDPGGLLGGLWGPPVVEHDDPTPPGTVEPKLPVEVSVDASTVLGRIEHTFSHKRWKVRILPAQLRGEAPSGEAWSWVQTDDVQVPTSALDERVFELLAD